MFHEFTPWRDCDRETGNPLVADAACGAGLSGAERARIIWPCNRVSGFPTAYQKAIRLV